MSKMYRAGSGTYIVSIQGDYLKIVDIDALHSDEVELLSIPVLDLFDLIVEDFPKVSGDTEVQKMADLVGALRCYLQTVEET